MAARDNERIVRRFFDEVLSGRSLDAADQLVAAEIVDHTPLLTDAPAGLEGVKQLARALHATYGGAFTNLQINLEDLFTAGADRVIARWVMEGAQTGEFLGRPASNENVRLAGIDIFRVADNKIVERWGQVDRQELLAQFDAPAAPAGAAAGGATSDAQRPATAAPGGAAVTRAARAAAPSGSLAGQGSAPVAGAGTSADDSSGPVGAAAEQGLGTPQVTRMVRDDLQRDPLALTETVRYGFMRRLESQEPVLVRYSERETFDPIPDAEGAPRRLAIYEGDIILGPAEQVKAWSSDILAPAITGITGAGAAGGAALRGERFRWPGGRVPFVIEQGLPNPERVTRAMQHWEQRTRIRFFKHTNEPDRVVFRRGPGCASYIGKQGGAQLIELADGCGVGNAIHEIGHTLGLFHEQSRLDRDRFVRIVWQNIKPEALHNFDQYSSTEGMDVGPYDFGSIMHYHGSAFSKNGQPTIVPLRGEAIGQRDHLSEDDIRTITAMYPVADEGDTSDLAAVSVDELLRGILVRLQAGSGAPAPPSSAPLAAVQDDSVQRIVRLAVPGMLEALGRAVQDLASGQRPEQPPVEVPPAFQR